MIITSPEQFRHYFQSHPLPAPGIERPATPKAIFMVQPEEFYISKETAQDNVYMQPGVSIDSRLAARQHRDLANAISNCGVPVIRFPGRPGTPDDLFPNNVFGTAPGRLIIGAMRYPKRRLEAQRTDIREFFTRLLQYTPHDLSLQPDTIAELTGALVIDRSRRIGYCGLTQRVNEAGCQAMQDAFDLNITYQFELKPDEYHTNVVMSVLADRVLVICPNAFVDSKVPDSIAELYPDRVLELTDEEKTAYAGNCLAVTDSDLMISATAADKLGDAKLQQLQDWGFSIHAVPFDEIEKAGGSVRCTIGEVF